MRTDFLSIGYAGMKNTKGLMIGWHRERKGIRSESINLQVLGEGNKLVMRCLILYTG